jgi:regulator of replication initiation timing
MTDLTEQYQKGELELDKNYYIELEDGTIEIQMFVGGFLCRKDNEVKEVLNKVPSYDELQNINKSVNDLMASNIKLVDENKQLQERLKKTQELELEVRRENTKLKELLKECREPLEVLAEKRNACDWYPEDLLSKFYQALGEDK